MFWYNFRAQDAKVQRLVKHWEENEQEHKGLKEDLNMQREEIGSQKNKRARANWQKALAAFRKANTVKKIKGLAKKQEALNDVLPIISK